jgi:hypothetical protein
VVNERAYKALDNGPRRHSHKIDKILASHLLANIFIALGFTSKVNCWFSGKLILSYRSPLVKTKVINAHKIEEAAEL